MIEIGGRTRLDPLRALVGVTKACRPPVGLLAIPSTHLLTPAPPGHYPPLTPLSLAINPLNISHLTPHGHYTPSAFHVLGKLLFERWSLLVDNDIAQRAIALNPPPPRSRHWVALFSDPSFPF